MMRKDTTVTMGRSSGFTIVELLIVVVVIAILAAIAIVAYNGVTQRARASSAQTAASQTAKKVATYGIENNVYPTTLDALKIFSSNGVTYQYSVNNSSNPKGYCVTINNGGVTYYMAETFTHNISGGGTVNQISPAPGVCPGHNASGTPTIINLAINPNVEVNTTGLSGPNGSTVARSTTRAHSGAASALVTMPGGYTWSNVGVTFLNYPDLTTTLEPNTLYTASAWVWVPTGTVDVYMSVQGTGKTNLLNPPDRVASVKNQWFRVYNTFETTSSGTVMLRVLNEETTPAGSFQFWVDDFMLVKGSTPYAYADGDSAGWSWSGTAGNSTSSGPAI